MQGEFRWKPFNVVLVQSLFKLKGFSGAPLLNTNEKKGCLYQVVGINSITLVCGSGYPSVYTRVSAYLDWIENIVWFDGNGTIAETPTTQPPPVQSGMANRTFVKSK